MRYDFFTPPDGPSTAAPDGEYPAVTVTLEDGSKERGYVTGWTPTLVMVHWIDQTGWSKATWFDAADVVRDESRPAGSRKILYEAWRGWGMP